MILKACCHTLYKDCTWSFKEGRFLKLSLHIRSVLLSRRVACRGKVRSNCLLVSYGEVELSLVA